MIGKDDRMKKTASLLIALFLLVSITPGASQAFDVFLKNAPTKIYHTTWQGNNNDSNRTVPHLRVHPHRIAFETSHTYPRADPLLC